MQTYINKAKCKSKNSLAIMHVNNLNLYYLCMFYITVKPLLYKSGTFL